MTTDSHIVDDTVTFVQNASKASYQVKVVNSVDNLDCAQWDSLNAKAPFTASQWLRVAEAVTDALEPLYIQLYDGKQLVGTAVASVTRQTGVSISSALGRRLIKAILDRYPLVVCQAPLGGASGFHLPAGDEVSALQAIVLALRKVALSRRASFTIFGRLRAGECEVVRRADSFRYVAMDDSTFLPVAWSSFDQYVASLSKSAQKDLRRHQNRARDLGVRIERSHQFVQYQERLLQLVRNVERQHGSVGSSPYNDQLFAIIEQSLRDNSIMLLAWADKTLAACGLVLHDAGAMTLVSLGMDYNFKYVYFQLVYEAIRYAIEMGLQVVYGGTGAYEFKLRLGFQHEPTFVAFTSHYPILQWIGKQLATAVQREDVPVAS